MQFDEPWHAGTPFRWSPYPDGAVVTLRGCPRAVGSNGPGSHSQEQNWGYSRDIPNPRVLEPRNFNAAGLRIAQTRAIYFHFFPLCVYSSIYRSEVKVTQLCPTLWDPMDYIAHGTLQARILEWVAFPFSRGSSRPRNWTGISCMAGGFFPSWAVKKVNHKSTAY